MMRFRARVALPGPADRPRAVLFPCLGNPACANRGEAA